MNGQDITQKLQNIVPPYQPDLLSHVLPHSYKSSVSKWCDRNMKNLALSMEFTTLSGEPPVVNIYPDACMKIIFECNPEDPNAIVLGVNSEHTKLHLKANTTYFMLVPYSHLVMNLKPTPLELLNAQFELKDVVSPKERGVFSKWERIAAAGSFEERAEIARDEVNRLLVSDTYSPNLVEFCSLAMCLSPRTFKMSELKDYTGYSERYCREEFRKYFGLSPKLYNRILRFQGAIKSLCEPNQGEAFRILEEYGYYDQSHFIKEIRCFTGEAPMNFRAHCNAR
jgi:AraC-like DNA-binding protein